MTFTVSDKLYSLSQSSTNHSNIKCKNHHEIIKRCKFDLFTLVLHLHEAARLLRSLSQLLLSSGLKHNTCRVAAAPSFKPKMMGVDM